MALTDTPESMDFRKGLFGSIVRPNGFYRTKAGLSTGLQLKCFVAEVLYCRPTG